MKFDEKKDEIPPRACRHTKSGKQKNDVQEGDPQKVKNKTNNVQKVGAQQVNKQKNYVQKVDPQQVETKSMCNKWTLKKSKQIHVQKVVPKKVEKNNLQKVGPPPVRSSGGSGGGSPLGKS